MTAKQLKNSILQMAIQGKLVPQNPADEPVKVTIYKDETPFDVPKNWVWAKLGDAFNMQAGKFIKACDIHSEYTPKRYPCYGGNGLRGYVDTFNIEGVFPLIGRQGALCGNINMASGKFYATEHAVIAKPNIDMDMSWVHYTLIFLNLNQYSTATAQPGLAVSKISNVPIPIPPLAEQHRIVARIEELLPLVETYGEKYDALETLNKSFPIDLKKSILQAAVQGKLVEQDPADEPAAVLLERIKAEKERLIKEGKIKRGKPLPEIKEDEVSFDLPDGWVWCRLGEIVTYNMGKTPPRKELEYWENPTHAWVSIADMVSDGVIDSTKESVNDYAYKNVFKGRKSIKGTLLMSFKLTVGKTSLLGIDAFHNEAIISIYPFIDCNDIMKLYLFKTLPLLSQSGNTKKAIKGNTLNSDSIDALLIPLPPIKEQERIVAMIEELLGVTEGLIGS